MSLDANAILTHLGTVAIMFGLWMVKREVTKIDNKLDHHDNALSAHSRKIAVLEERTK